MVYNKWMEKRRVFCDKYPGNAPIVMYGQNIARCPFVLRCYSQNELHGGRVLLDTTHVRRSGGVGIDKYLVTSCEAAAPKTRARDLRRKASRTVPNESVITGNS